MNRRTQIIELDKRHVWHPYTAMGPYIEQASPLVIERASGSRLFDLDGKSYLDANSSWYCAVLGHCHPRLVAAAREQIERLSHVALAGITHEPAALLAEQLLARAPGYSRVFYSDNGSTSIEVALKLALQYWHQNGRPQRTRFLGLQNAFHGETLGATAIGGVEVFRRPFASVTLDCVHVSPDANGYDAAFAALSRIIEQQGDTIAALVLEPMVQGASGMRMYDASFLRAARALTEQHDIFLVLDEVFSGFGRTGPFWASQHANIQGDLLCTAKGLSGGILPFSATLVSERIFEGFLGPSERAFFYGHTYCGNPLGARVALEVLRVYDDERILQTIIPKAERIRAAFRRLGQLPAVSRTRTLGMIGALDLSGSEGYLETSGQRVYREALRRGAYLRPLGNTVYITPPINISDADLDELLEIVEASVRAALGQ